MGTLEPVEATKELEALIAEATQAIAGEELLTSASELPGIKDVIANLRAEKDKKASLEAELTIVNKQIDKYTQVALELLDAAGIRSIVVEGIGQAYQHTSMRPTVLDADRLLEWAQENAPDIIKTGIHPQTLASTLRERMENGEPLPDEDVVRIYYQKSVNLRRS